MSKIVNEFSSYMDKYGFMSLNTDGTKGEPTQNGPLFTMDYLIALISNLDNLDPNELESEIQRINKAILACEIFPGVTRRNPDSTEADSMDNGTANHSFSYLFGNSQFAIRKLAHGQSIRATGIEPNDNFANSFKYYPLAWILSGFKPPRYFWNNKSPSLFTMNGWHGRSPGHIAFLKKCAKSPVGPLGNLSIWVGQFLGLLSPYGSTEGVKLSYISWQALKEMGIAWKLSYKIWCFLLTLKYKNGMIDVNKIYYRDPFHPINKYSKKYT